MTRTGDDVDNVEPWWECKMVPPLWETIWQFLKT